MFVHNISPVLFSLGPVEIRYYGLLYVLGFVITYVMLKQLTKKGHLKLSSDAVDTLMVYLILGVVVGARLAYVLFYNPFYYLANPLQILAVWQGGLSFHGGLAGVCLATYWFSKKKKVSFLRLADVLTIPAALALAIGRIGNFLNGELYGRVTDVPWATKFSGAEGYRHPSQLYESAKNLLIFIVLFNLRDHKHKPGFLLGMFMTLYGLLRFLVEFVREPEIVIASLTMGQWLSLPVFVIGIIVVLRTK